MNKSINQAIKMLELCFKIKLSAEQKRIVEYDLKTPVRVIACAGSGKTMLFLFMALALIVNGQTEPKDVLGITFSKRAQMSMGRRYNQDLGKMHYWGADSYVPDNSPYFTTFHALFYRLIKDLPEYQHIHVIASYKFIQPFLAQYIVKKSRKISAYEQLHRTFTWRNHMINKGLTFDGLTEQSENQNYPSQQAKLLLGLREPDNEKETNMMLNYTSIAQAYNEYKEAHHLIDFPDMMTKLFQIISHNHDEKKIIQSRMFHFKYVFLDEFQDINTLQWKLMKLILPRHAKQHLMVIGDDDQSIYSFRGSNPDIILNYQKDYPKSHTFTLSTNYRTGGNILKIVKPLIQSNQYRLNKKLLTAHKNEGQITEYFSQDKRTTANQMLLERLWDDIQNPRIPNKDLAVLVHYNNSRMFIIDWLANHHKYIKSNNKKYLLQNDHVYQNMMMIIKGFVLDDIIPLYKEAVKIGRQTYKRHMKSVIRMSGKRITTYLLLTHSGDARNRKTDTRLYETFKMFKKSRNKGSMAVICARIMLRGYYKYLIDNKFISKVEVKSVIRYLYLEMQDIKKIRYLKKFLMRENVKHHRLSKVTRRTAFPITILTLHQSKGLQFPIIFLYDINARRDSKGEIKLSNAFNPRLSITQFLNKLRKMSIPQVHELDRECFGKGIFAFMLDQITDAQRKNPKKNVVKLIIDHKFNKTKNQKKCQNFVWGIYRQIIHSSKFIEEQRRLIYVGVTRAEKQIYIAYNRDADPLLDELNIPNSDKALLKK